MKNSSMMLTLVHCGETPWEQEGRLHGRTDLPLSEVGLASVRADAERVVDRRLGIIFHPDDEAAAETARVIAEHTGPGKAKRRAIEDLAEPDLGLLEGLHQRQFVERFAKRRKQWEDDPLSLVPPEGEPFADARARILSAVAKALKRTRVREVGIVLHPIALGLLRCWLADRPPSDMWRLLETGDRIERYVFAVNLVDELRESVAPVES